MGKKCWAILALLVLNGVTSGVFAQAEVPPPAVAKDPFGLELREEGVWVVLNLQAFAQIKEVLGLVPLRNEADQKQLVDVLKLQATTPLQRETYFQSTEAKKRLAEIQEYLNKQFRVVLPVGPETPARLSDYDLKAGAFTLTLPQLPELAQLTFAVARDDALRLEKARDGGQLTLGVELILRRATATSREVVPAFIALRLLDAASGNSWPVPLPVPKPIAGKTPVAVSGQVPDQAAAGRSFKLKDGRVIHGLIVMQVGDRIGVKDSTGKVVIINLVDLADNVDH